jgi:ABC-type lipoprotein release transport system permease subunit
LTRRASSLLYEVSPADPAVFTVVALCLAAVAAAASYLPARRAARIDPALTLREE